MNESKISQPADTLISLIKSSLTSEGLQGFDHLVLYTSFGAVRGRIGLAFAQELTDREGRAAEGAASPTDIIELNDVTIEHYSNHLPTASFERFYVRLADINGFALVGLPGQG